MKFGEIFAGFVPIAGLAAVIGLTTLDRAINSNSETVVLSSGSEVNVRQWKNKGTEVFIGGFQTLHDTNNDGIVDYLSGGAMGRIGTIRYTRKPTPALQSLYDEAISKSSVVDSKRS
ncbi:MAG: hypothetical protein AABX54_04800 [Nanoarchaeota archaeon]